MGRLKKYDENAVLEKAMMAFWQKGFKNITTRDLAEAMDINQYSLYSSFTSKEELFVKALEFYSRHMFENYVLKMIGGEDRTLDDLRFFLERLVSPPSADAPKGCLICNTMSEEISQNDQVAEVLQRYKAKLVEAFTTILRNTYPSIEKEILTKKAAFLYGSLIGLAIQKRMGFHGQPVQDYVDEFMNAVTYHEVAES